MSNHPSHLHGLEKGIAYTNVRVHTRYATHSPQMTHYTGLVTGGVPTLSVSSACATAVAICSAELLLIEPLALAFCTACAIWSTELIRVGFAVLASACSSSLARYAWSPLCLMTAADSLTSSEPQSVTFRVRNGEPRGDMVGMPKLGLLDCTKTHVDCCP